MSPKYKALLISAAMIFSPACLAQNAPTEAPSAGQPLDPVQAAPAVIKDLDPAL